VPDSSAGPFWEARLTGLEENTLYFYRIGDGPEHTFRTPPPRGSSDFWIAEEADIGSTLDYSAVGPTQLQIAQDHPDIPGDDRPRFVLVPGDLSYGDQNARDPNGNLPEVDRHFNDVMSWSQDAAYMVVWGNHEWRDSSEGAKADDLQNYKGRFDFPNSQTSPGAPAAGGPGEDWHWFDYGHVRFIAYPEPYTSGTSGTLANWESQADLVMAAAEVDPLITFIVTFGHRPAYSTGHHSTYKLDGTLSDPAKHLVGIFDRLRSKYPKYVLNIAAHSHNYERTCPIKGVAPAEFCTTADQGLVHITGAGGGATLEVLEESRPWTVYRTKHLEHVKIHFTPTRIEGFVVCGPDASEDDNSCTEGAIIDTWTIAADVTPPVTTATLSPGANPQGWNNATGTVTLSATDDPDGSGVKEIQYSMTGAETGAGVVSGSVASVPISAEGTTTLTFFARDNAGNQEDPQALTVKIDKTFPLVAVTRTPAPNADGWNNTDITVSFSAADALSGIEVVSGPVIVTSEGAGQVVSGTATDRAGNSASMSVTLNIDKTPPVVAGLPASGCSLWPPNHRLVQVAAVTASDGLSGLAPGSPAVAGISTETGSARGNGDALPDIVITGGAVQLRADRSGRGTGRTYTVTATASDLAGNPVTATGTCTVPHDRRQR
jgi:hypothetical protein